MRRASTLLAVLLVLACYKSGEDASVSQAGAPEDAVAAKSAIEAQNARFEAAMLKGDTGTMVSTYTSDAIVLPQGMPMARGRGEIAKSFAGMLSQASVSKFELHLLDLTMAGDHAIETGTYAMTMTPKAGKPIDDVGKYIAIWKKDADGSWKMVRDIFNSDKGAM